MGSRYEAIGIKQVIRLEWMNQCANLLMSGMDPIEIRAELHDYLAGRNGSDSAKERGTTSRTQAVNMLMNIWITPDTELVPFRDSAIAYLQANPVSQLAVHWGMIAAAYPFWGSVAKQVGRVLSLQDQVTQVQIFNRLKEQYGDRETVSRYARYAVRSMVAWGVLIDSNHKGCYEIGQKQSVDDPDLTILLLESALLSSPEGKAATGVLLSNPAFFPFSLPPIQADLVSQRNSRLTVVRYGMDDDLLKLA